MRWLIKLVLIIAACLALLVILFAAPTPAPAPAPQGALVRGTVAARLDFRIHSGLITVPVRINGSKELRRMFLVPNAYFRRPLPFNMAGLVLEQDRDDIYFVRYVVENSPAGENGLKEGDKITAINGLDTRKYPCLQVLDIFNAAGKKVNLTLERGGERFEKTLKLRRLI
jgi:S1-C subfamily serine protease